MRFSFSESRKTCKKSGCRSRFSNQASYFSKNLDENSETFLKNIMHDLFLWEKKNAENHCLVSQKFSETVLNRIEKKKKVLHHIDFYYFETISHPKILRVLWFLFQACCCNQKKDKQKASKQSEVWSNFSFFHRIHIHLLIKRRRKIQLKG